MRKLLPLPLIVLILLISCVYAQKISQAKLVGTWVLNKNQINYPIIIFENKEAIFKSRGDTIYRFNYSVRGQELILTDINKNVSKAIIVNLSKDTLIFRSLLENKEEQHYLRKRK